MDTTNVRDVLELSRILNAPSNSGDTEADVIAALIDWADRRAGLDAATKVVAKAKGSKATESPDSFEPTADPSEPDF